MKKTKIIFAFFVVTYGPKNFIVGQLIKSILKNGWLCISTKDHLSLEIRKQRYKENYRLIYNSNIYNLIKHHELIKH